MPWPRRRSATWCAYELGAWDGYLLPALIPEAARLPVHLGRRPSPRSLPDGLRWFVFHVNLTDTRSVPPERAAFCRTLEERGVTVLNGRLVDVGKRTVQSICKRVGLGDLRAGPEGDPCERLIVKTHRNFGGRPEARLAPRQRALLGLGEEAPPSVRPLEYPVRLRRELDPACFRDPELAVERYVEDGAGTFYRAYVLGGQLVLCRYRDPREVKKMFGAAYVSHHCLELGEGALASGAGVEEIRRSVARFCAAAGMDFGALDLCPDGAGRTFIVDANPTPYWGEGLRRPRWLDHLRVGAGSGGFAKASS